MSHHRRDLFLDWSTNFQPQARARHVLMRAVGRFFRNDRAAAVTRRPGNSSVEISRLIVNSILLDLTIICSERANRRLQSSITERSSGSAGFRCSRESMRPLKPKRSSLTEARTRSAATGESFARRAAAFCSSSSSTPHVRAQTRKLAISGTQSSGLLFHPDTVFTRSSARLPPTMSRGIQR